MITATSGWALVGTSQLWRTTDGGSSWSNVSPPHLSDRVIYGDQNVFLDAKTAFITELGGGRAGSPGLYWVTFRTVDGGTTWRKGASLTDPFKPGMAEVFFIDAKTGWVVVSNDGPDPHTPMLFGTHDGGMHWTLVTSGTGIATSPGMPSPCGADMMFESRTAGWMSLAMCVSVPSQNGSSTPDSRVVRQVLLVTRDGGVTWQVQTLPITAAADDRFDVPVFLDPLHGIIVVSGAHPALLTTSDGGTTWNTRSLPGESQTNVDFVDPTHGWALAGPSSMFAKTRDNSQRMIPLPLYRTDDGGSTWMPVSSNLTLESPVGVVFSNVRFVNSTTGFLTLYTLALGPTKFLKTTDGGLTWKPVLVCEKGLGNQFPPPACK